MNQKKIQIGLTRFHWELIETLLFRTADKVEAYERGQLLSITDLIHARLQKNFDR
jgi:hypothetical protein